MISGPLLSIVIPTFNATKTLSWCLDSIANSDYPIEKLEVLIVDNNSTDELKEFLKKYDFVSYVLEKRQGRSWARNRGIELAKAPLIAFLDADVYLSPTWLSVVSKLFERIDIGGAGAKIIPTDELGLSSLNKFRIKSIKKDTSNHFTLMQIICFEAPMLNSAACMYRKEALQRTGGFDTELERHEDIDLSKRVMLSGFNLFTTWKTESFVHYHGENWKDYYRRAFEDGRTKIDYLRKWEKFVAIDLSSRELTDTDQNNSLVLEKGEPKSKNFYLKEVFFSFLWLVKSFLSDISFFWLIKFSLMSVQYFGRIYGMMTSGDHKPFSIERSLDHLTEDHLKSRFLKDFQFLFFDNFVYKYSFESKEISTLGFLENVYFDTIFDSSNKDKNLFKAIEKRVEETLYS